MFILGSFTIPFKILIGFLRVSPNTFPCSLVFVPFKCHFPLSFHVNSFSSFKGLFYFQFLSISFFKIHRDCLCSQSQIFSCFLPVPSSCFPKYFISFLVSLSTFKMYFSFHFQLYLTAYSCSHPRQFYSLFPTKILEGFFPNASSLLKAGNQAITVPVFVTIFFWVRVLVLSYR